MGDWITCETHYAVMCNYLILLLGRQWQDDGARGDQHPKNYTMT